MMAREGQWDDEGKGTKNNKGELRRKRREGTPTWPYPLAPGLDFTAVEKKVVGEDWGTYEVHSKLIALKNEHHMKTLFVPCNHKFPLTFFKH